MFKALALTVLATACLTLQAAKTPALEGFDPVLLTEGKEAAGDAKFTSEHGRFLYQFASAETKARFDQDPDRYSIQLDGACARMGPPVGGSPDAYYVYKNRIYIFGSQQCYRSFVAAPEKYLDSGAAAVWNPSPQSQKQGEELLRKMREAMGGAVRLDGIRSFTETRHTQAGDREATTQIAARLPDETLTETKVGANSYGNLVSGAEGYNLFRGERTPMPASFAKVVRQDARRNILAILVNRHAQVAAENGALLIHDEGVVTKVELDSAGRISAVSHRGRGPEGNLGTLRVAYSDYREVEGLWLPFKGDLSFDGQVLAGRSWTVESYAINPAARTI